MQQQSSNRKVVIVGAGAVGATFAYALAQEGTAREIVLVDRNRELAEGQALDLAHGLPYVPSVTLRAGGGEDYRDASLIVITAGAKQEPGESRLRLLNRNAGIVGGIMDEIVAAQSPAVVVLVTNPVDVLTYVAIRRSGWDDGRIFGSGTVLDSARFRYLVSQCSGVSVRNVHAYILGEHGDSEIPAWSISNIAGIRINDFCPQCGRCESWQTKREEIARQVRESAYHIIDYKGATYFAIGLALVRIAAAVLRNDSSVLTVSTLLSGQYDLSDVCLSVPCIVDAGGVRTSIDAGLNREELDGLHNSARILKEQIAGLDDHPDTASAGGETP